VDNGQIMLALPPDVDPAAATTRLRSLSGVGSLSTSK
jgi:hypothetical protein